MLTLLMLLPLRRFRATADVTPHRSRRRCHDAAISLRYTLHAFTSAAPPCCHVDA